MFEKISSMLKTRGFIFLITFLFALSASFAVERAASAAKTYKLVVKIKAKKTEVKKGVTVELTGENLETPKTATTKKNGIVKFRKLTKGTYTVTPTKDDYTFEPKEITFKKRKSVSVSFKPKKVKADVTAKKTTDDLSSPDAAGWANITASSIQTTGNPSTGGHGNVGGESGLVTVNLQAAHDSTNIFMRFEWDDSTQNNAHEVWTYSASSSTWSKEGNEDRILISWPITDVAGREGKTFQQIGCAMLCHLKDTTDTSKIVPNTADAVNDCSVCHPNSSGKDTSFVHPLVPSGSDCSSCHGGADRDPGGEVGDMGSPAGGAFDIWHWKAGRSDGIGLAEDQEASDGGMRTNDGAGITSNNDGPTGFTDRPKYIWTAASGKGASPSTEIIKNSEIANLVATDMLATINATDGKYYLSNGTTEEVPADGAQVRRRILKDDAVTEPGNGDIKASSSYSGGKWAVVLKRKFDTTDTKDYVLKTGETDVNYFGFAVTDNSGHNHKGKSLLTLIFEQ